MTQKGNTNIKYEGKYIAKTNMHMNEWMDREVNK